MTLLLGMITPLGWLERVPTYKERLRDMAERDIANLGLLGYPVLQTVDITIVQRRARAGGGGPGLAPRDLARDRAPVQPALRRRARGTAGAAVRLPDDPGIGRPEDVEVARQRDRARRRPGHDPREGPDRSSRTRRRSAAATPAGPRSVPYSPCTASSLPTSSSGPRSTAGPGSSGASTARRTWPTASSSSSRRSGSAARSSPRNPGLVADVLAAGVDRARPVVEATMAAVRNAMHFG